MKKLFSAIPLLIFIFYSCGDNLSIGKKISGTNYRFVNQDSIEVKFDSLIQNKITLIGFIYTHCPDICPMTTHNLFLTEQKLKDEGIKNIEFILISFDPDRDKPSVLNNFGRVRGLNMKNWQLLTGEKQSVNRFNRMMGVKAIPADSTYSEDGMLNYYMIHTDRITLLDNEGRIRAEYKGSTIDPKIILTDIKKIGD
jgi:protein SCO1/2